MVCKLCLDKKHVWSQYKNAWVHCDCYLLGVRNQYLKLAGIPEYYWDFTLDKLPSTSPSLKSFKNAITKISDILKSGNYPNKPLIISATQSLAKPAAYILVRSALPSFTCRYASLDELTTMFLSQDKREEFIRVRDTQVLGLYFGDEYCQTIHKHLIKNITDYRSDARFTTIGITPIVSVAAMNKIYGDLCWDKTSVWIRCNEEMIV